MKTNLNKKALLVIVGFVVFVILISVIFLVVGMNNKNYTNNPGGTGGDYLPPNTVIFTNDGILYESVGGSATDDIKLLAQIAVVYDISISNNPDAPSDFVKIDSFNKDSTNTHKIYKNNKTYKATVDDGKVTQDPKLPWNYWFYFTTDDNRHFRVDSITDNNDDVLLSVKKND